MTGQLTGRPTQAPRLLLDPELQRSYRAQGWWTDSPLSDVVRQRARDQGHSCAFIDDEGHLSWAEYDGHADWLARALVACDLPVGTRVAVLLPDSAGVHVAYLGAERAGLVVVGIGYRTGEREILDLITRTSAAALITLDHHGDQSIDGLVSRLRAAGANITTHLVVPPFASRTNAPILRNGHPIEPTTPDTTGGRGLGPDDLFFINSTSGTTGTPKCVMHHQNRWMFFHQQAAGNASLGADDVLLSAVPTPFGFGLWSSHFTPALLGAPAVVMQRFDPRHTLELVERHHVTVLCCVATQFVMMLNHRDFSRFDLSSLRVLFTGGEKVSYQRAQEFEDRTGCTILQFYGSNETGLLSGTRLDDPPILRLTTAGRVAPEMAVRLFDNGEDVTIRGWGQPAARGPALSLGYLDDLDANTLLIRPDGWMLMGDICEIDENGYLTVTGRTSDLIIRGGKNISASRVEDEVATHPSVALVCAVACPDPVYGERVCVYVESALDSALTLDSLLEHLRLRGTSKELWPEFLVNVTELPRTTGGKIAKAELRADAQARAWPKSSVHPVR